MDAKDCSCDPSEVDFSYDNCTFDEHQCSVPGVCMNCGRKVEFVYTEVGLRDSETGEYLYEA